MQTEYVWNSYSILLFFSGMIILPVLYIIWKKRHVSGALPLFLFFLATILWNWGFALQTAALHESDKVFWRLFSYIWVYMSPALFLNFVVRLTHKTKWYSLPRIILGLAISLLPFLMALVNYPDFPFWESYTISEYGMIVPQFGPAFALSLFLVYFMLGTGVFLLFRYYRLLRKPYRSHFRIILVGTLFPVFINLLANFAGESFRKIDLTPVSFSVTSILLTLGFFYYRLLDVMPVARHLLMEHISDGFLLLDENDRMIDHNPAFLKFFPEFKAVFPGNKVPSELKLNFQVPEKFSEKETEWEILPSSDLALNVKFFRFQDGKRLVGQLFLFRDITEKRQTFKKMEKEKEKAEQSSLEKDRFFSILSHDLKNPFASLIGFTELLTDSFDEYSDSEKLELMKKVLVSAKCIYHLFEELLEWYQLESGRIEAQKGWVQVPPLVSQIWEILKEGALAKSVSLEIDRDLKSCVSGDERILAVILRNLLSNAVKYSFPEGKIRVHSLSKPGYQGIAVSDHGVGLASREIKNLFSLDRESLSRPGTGGEQGTGLGLFFCAHLAKKAGYVLEAETNPRGGSTFKVWLPEAE